MNVWLTVFGNTKVQFHRINPMCSSVSPTPARHCHSIWVGFCPVRSANVSQCLMPHHKQTTGKAPSTTPLCDWSAPVPCTTHTLLDLDLFRHPEHSKGPTRSSTPEPYRLVAYLSPFAPLAAQVRKGARVICLLCLCTAHHPHQSICKQKTSK
jgi:hypothetical protein